MRLTIKHLVTDGLGYCCTWFFFKKYRRTQMVADRLGVTRRAVQYAKQRVRSGEDRCERCGKCMKKWL